MDETHIFSWKDFMISSNIPPLVAPPRPAPDMIQILPVGFYMDLSENSVSPITQWLMMVNDYYPYWMAIIGNIPYFQTNPYGFMIQ